MAIRPIVILGSPNEAVLHRPSARVKDPRDKRIQELIDDMFETMRDAPGVGLAAPQIGVPLRVVVVEAIDAAFPAMALINPEIVKRSGTRRLTEGCLSLPGYQGELTRAEHVLVKALGRDGKEMRIKAPPNSLLSQALEHEIGHINGHLYLDLLDRAEDLYRLNVPPRRSPPAENEAVDAANA